MKLKIGYFYSKLLNLYGDNGNIEILSYRALKRGFDVEVLEINPASSIDGFFMSNLNLVFMGGGPDSSQKIMYEDLVKNKGPYLADYVNRGGVGLYICGSYQLLGHYYKSADGTLLDGLNVFDLYTEHFGNKKPRCIGNITCTINETISQSSEFKNVTGIGTSLVGFENHGGRTYFNKADPAVKPFATVLSGYGNNADDGTEGIHFNNSIGTYMHGPILARNPHLADYLIAKSLNIASLEPLEDDLINAAHTASLKLT